MNSNTTTRQSWPTFERPSKFERHLLSERFCLSAVGLALASSRGWLRCTTIENQRCWILTDTAGRVAFCRRLDGQKFQSGETVIRFGTGGIGLDQIQPDCPVMVTECDADFLAAYDCIVREGAADYCAVVGLEELTPREAQMFRGASHVRLFPKHGDGKPRGIRWIRSLTPVFGAESETRISVWAFDKFRRADGAQVRSLADIAFVDPDDFQTDSNLQAMCP